MDPKIFLVSISWVQKFFSWELIYSRSYFVVPKGFLMGISFRGNFSFFPENFVIPNLFFVRISWFQNFFSWEFCWSEIFSLGYFVGSIFFLVANFVIQIWWLISLFVVVASMRKNGRKQKNIKYISNRLFYSKSIYRIVSSVYIWKVVQLLNKLCNYVAFICTYCIFSHLFSSVLG